MKELVALPGPPRLENSRLRKAVDLTLDKLMLQEAPGGNF